jgi:beta-galactosidase beta subunit
VINRILKSSFLFAVFVTALICMLGIHTFFEEGNALYIVYSFIGLSLFLVQFLISFVFNRFISSISWLQRVTYISYLFSASISAVLCYVLFDIKPAVFYILLSAFLIPSLFPLISNFLQGLFQETKFQESEGIDKADRNSEDIRFKIENESGKLLLDLSVHNIICFESNDNYALTYYFDKEGKVKKSMDRISLKRIEELLTELNVEYFFRVHKSYLVNQIYIEAIKGRAQAHKLKLNQMDILIPVSRTFSIDVLRKDL